MAPPNAPRGQLQTTGEPILSTSLLKRMTEVLAVTDPANISKLRERVEAALLDYQIATRHPMPTRRELRRSFEKLDKSYRTLIDSFNKLGPTERQVLDAAGKELQSVGSGRYRLSGATDVIAALSPVGVLIRQAQRHLPEVKRGPHTDTARYLLVARLGAIYGQTKSETQSDGKVLYEMPTRRHDGHVGRDYGPFRDFVVLVHEALGVDDPARGIDDVIRDLWPRMGKKRP